MSFGAENEAYDDSIIIRRFLSGVLLTTSHISVAGCKIYSLDKQGLRNKASLAFYEHILENKGKKTYKTYLCSS